jgi:hypothetical protein
MKRYFCYVVIAAFSVVAIAAFDTSAAFAATSNGSVSKHQVILSSDGAPNHDLHLRWYRSFERFEASHPHIARAFQRDPVLIMSNRFQREQPAWNRYLKAHPEIARAIRANPGDYIRIEPRYASAFEQYRDWSSAHPHLSSD